MFLYKKFIATLCMASYNKMSVNTYKVSFIESIEDVIKYLL